MKSNIVVGGHKVDVYTNFALAYSAVPDRAVVVVHGTDRNVEDYYNRMLAAAKKAGVQNKTLVLAPYFKDWSNSAWKEGGAGLKNGPSSFLVMDQLLALANNKALFPNLQRIVAAGHSAGGQFTQRYAIFGLAPAGLSYIVANPSSYCYLDLYRPVTGVGTCKNFNRYKYGMDSRSGYVAALTTQLAVAQYLARRVIIANGGSDSTHDNDLDVSCEAMLQGQNRLDRGNKFAHQIAFQYPHAPHSQIIVPGVGHDSAKMFASPLLRPALFGVSP